VTTSRTTTRTTARTTTKMSTATRSNKYNYYKEVKTTKPVFRKSAKILRRKFTYTPPPLTETFTLDLIITAQITA